jgi:general secretion pathway protein G
MVVVGKRDWKAILRALYEVVGGLAILLVAALIIAPKVISRNGSGIDPVKSDLSSIKSALDSFRIDCDRYPTEDEGLAALVTAPSGLENKWKAPYLSAVPVDPWQIPYVYHYPGAAGADSFMVDCPQTSDHIDLSEGGG